MNQDLEKQFTFPWYRKGLRFSCTQCGKCCTGSPGYVWVTEEEMVKMARSLKLTLSAFKRLYVRRVGHRFALVEQKSENHSCVFYQDKKCRVYQNRPLQCQTYPFWKENLHSKESWDQAAKTCEGIHPDSTHIPFETIQNFLEEQCKQYPEEHYVPATENLV